MGRVGVVGATGAAAGLVASAIAARRREVTAQEESVFRRFNDANDAIRGPAWVLMQAGSLGAVVVAASGTRCRRGTRDGAVVLVAGHVVWAGVKLVKPLVGRGRPGAHLDHVTTRGAPQKGRGYPSGHAAVATTLAITATRRGPSRAVALLVALSVGCGRMYVGAHLPLDVVGGLSAGTLGGLLARRAMAPSHPPCSIRSRLP